MVTTIKLIDLISYVTHLILNKTSNNVYPFFEVLYLVFFFILYKQLQVYNYNMKSRVAIFLLEIKGYSRELLEKF